MQDKLHQPYRCGLIDHYDQVFRMTYELGSLGTYVSGAGPTIIAFVDAAHSDDFIRQVGAHLEEKGITGWKTEILRADSEGARIVIE